MMVGISPYIRPLQFTLFLKFSAFFSNLGLFFSVDETFRLIRRLFSAEVPLQGV